MKTINLISQNYPNFSKGYKKIADYILKNIDIFLNQSASEIGKSSKTSAATVVRFSKNQGFKGLDDFKIAIAKSSTFYNHNEEIELIFSKEDSIEIMSDKFVKSTVDAFYKTKNLLDYKKIEMAVSYILNAKRVYIYAIGASGQAGYDLYHKLNRSDIHSFYDFDTHMSLEFSHYINDDDLVIAISYSGLTKEVILPTKEGKKNGAKVIVISGNMNSSLYGLADIFLTIPKVENIVRIGAFSSRYSTMLITDLLFLGVVKNTFEDIKPGYLRTSELVKKLKEQEG